MLNNKKVSLSDILRDFDRGLLGKTAEELEEEAAAAGPVEGESEEYSAPEEPEYESPVEEDEEEEDEDYEDEDEDDEDEHDEECECDVCQMQDALDDLQESQSDAIDAAETLRDMADEYIDKHDEEIVKEAALFGQIFAKSACDYMGKYASYYDPYEYEEARSLVKQAADQAYYYTIMKLAEGEGDSETMALAAQAVSDAASAAKALVENLGGGESSDPEAEAGRAAAEAYNETMAQMSGGEAPSADEQAQAANAAYDEAANQIAQAQQPEPVAPTAAQQMPEVANNAYDQAMNQLQEQQGY